MISITPASATQNEGSKHVHWENRGNGRGGHARSARRQMAPAAGPATRTWHVSRYIQNAAGALRPTGMITTVTGRRR